MLVVELGQGLMRNDVEITFSTNANSCHIACNETNNPFLNPTSPTSILDNLALGQRDLHNFTSLSKSLSLAQFARAEIKRRTTMTLLNIDALSMISPYFSTQ
jgi:hypothetical protein